MVPRIFHRVILNQSIKLAETLMNLIGSLETGLDLTQQNDADFFKASKELIREVNSSFRKLLNAFDLWEPLPNQQKDSA